MPMVLWNSLFMEAQGYEVKDNIVQQDNKSKMLLAKGREDKIYQRQIFFCERQAGKEGHQYGVFNHSRHVRRFYNNTTKGRLYKTKFQEIMNTQSNNLDGYVTQGYKPSGSQECVGNNHPNRSEFVATQTGKLKHIPRFGNTLTYMQAVIDGHRRGISEVWDERQRSV